MALPPGSRRSRPMRVRDARLSAVVIVALTLGTAEKHVRGGATAFQHRVPITTTTGASGPRARYPPTIAVTATRDGSVVSRLALGGSPRRQSLLVRSPPTALRSSFYEDFENFDDDDDDDEELAKELDEAAVADFRSKMGSLFDDDDEEDDDDEVADDGAGFESEGAEGAGGISSVDDLISFATTKSAAAASAAEAPPTDWAAAVDLGGVDLSSLEGGIVLLANPSKFCSDFPSVDDDEDGEDKPKRSLGFNPFGAQPSPALLAKFGLTLPPPADLGPDRRADLLPVLVLLERHPLRGCQAVLMNRRTGYLLGDLEQQQAQEKMDNGEVPPPPNLGAFMIQPLWFGGTSAGGAVASDESDDDGASSGNGGGSGAASGLDMLHLCPTVPGAKPLTEDGLYWGGDPTAAQDAMQDPSLDRVMTGFDFKFFVQSTRWLPQQLEKEINDGTWYAASVSKEILFKSRDRLGTKRAKPLWSEIMELMGGKYKRVRDRLYEIEEK